VNLYICSPFAREKFIRPEELGWEPALQSSSSVPHPPSKNQKHNKTPKQTKPKTQPTKA